MSVWRPSPRPAAEQALDPDNYNDIGNGLNELDGDPTTGPSADKFQGVDGFEDNPDGQAISASFVSGYIQSRSDTFDFITASSLTGAFASQLLPAPNATNTLKPITLYTGVSARLFITSTADVNSDGILNSQDFFDFLNNLFNNPIDFNGDGIVNSQDFFDYLGVFFMG